MHPPITVVSSAHNVFTTKHTLLSLGIRGSQGCHPRTIYLLDIHYYHSIHTEMHPPITVVSSVHNVSTRHTLLSLKPYCTASADHVGVIGVLFVQKIYTITNCPQIFIFFYHALAKINTTNPLSVYTIPRTLTGIPPYK